jgi:hypothetical protein
MNISFYFCFYYFSLFGWINPLFMGEKLLPQVANPLRRSSLKSKKIQGKLLLLISFFCHRFLYQSIFRQIPPFHPIIYIWKGLKEPPLY